MKFAFEPATFASLALVTKAALLAEVGFYQAEPPGLARCPLRVTLINFGVAQQTPSCRHDFAWGERHTPVDTSRWNTWFWRDAIIFACLTFL